MRRGAASDDRPNDRQDGADSPGRGAGAFRGAAWGARVRHPPWRRANEPESPPVTAWLETVDTFGVLVEEVVLFGGGEGAGQGFEGFDERDEGGAEFVDREVAGEH